MITFLFLISPNIRNKNEKVNSRTVFAVIFLHLSGITLLFGQYLIIKERFFSLTTWLSENKHVNLLAQIEITV